MSKIENLTITDRAGKDHLVAPMVDVGFGVQASWNFNGVAHSIEIEAGTNQTLRVFLTPNEDFLLVFWGNSPSFPSPRNLVVLNPDGSIRHYPELPSGISSEYKLREERIGEQRARNSLIFLDAVMKDGKLAVWVGFASDYYESREFDPETGVFGECLEVGRA